LTSLRVATPCSTPPNRPPFRHTHLRLRTPEETTTADFGPLTIDGIDAEPSRPGSVTSRAGFGGAGQYQPGSDPERYLYAYASGPFVSTADGAAGTGTGHGPHARARGGELLSDEYKANAAQDGRHRPESLSSVDGFGQHRSSRPVSVESTYGFGAAPTSPGTAAAVQHGSDYPDGGYLTSPAEDGAETVRRRSR